MTACTQDSLDPFDPKQTARHGAFKGECIDATSVRPAVKISENNEVLEFANFYHNGKYWIAVVPRDGVAQANFQIVPFESGVPLIQAAHTQVRFLMSKPIRLRTQSGRYPKKRMEIRDVIVSSTFTAPKDQEYSTLKSFGGSYGIVTRFMSTVARANEEIAKDRSTVRQFKLNLTAVELNRLLAVSLERASDAGYDQAYALLSNNCTTIGMDTLDLVKSRPLGVHRFRGNIANIRDEFIAPTIQALKERGLIDNSSELEPLNSEVKCEGAGKKAECHFNRAATTILGSVPTN